MNDKPKVTLEDCPTGLFWFEGRTLGFKSEYMTETSSMGVKLYQCDAYVVSSGEYFWGGAKTGKERAELLVTPLNLDDQSEEFWAPFAYLPDDDEPEIEAADVTVHWATGPVHCCGPHAEKLIALGQIMGTHVHAEPYFGDEPCINCVNEAKKADVKEPT